eukprot:14363809-Alexandrium_andersonii.AAC.1
MFITHLPSGQTKRGPPGPPCPSGISGTSQMPVGCVRWVGCPQPGGCQWVRTVFCAGASYCTCTSPRWRAHARTRRHRCGARAAA